MIRPRLDQARQAIRARLQAGEELHWRDVWATVEDSSRTWAHDTLRKWHKAGEIHVVRWKRGMSGPAMPVYRWGPGKDAKRPEAMPNSKKCARYRRANPEKVAASQRRSHLRRRKGPILDPIIAAMLGYKKHGAGWIKPKEKSNV